MPMAVNNARLRTASSRALRLLVLMLVGLAPAAGRADEPPPPPSPECKHVQRVKFLSHGDPAGGFSKIVCTVDYWLCGKSYTRRSEPTENKRGACDGFTASVKNAIGAAVCCDR